MLIAVLLTGSHAFAHDFEVDGIYYNITSETDKTVEVTFKGNSYYEYSSEYSDAIIIPKNVTVNNITYTVNSISDWAFYYCTNLYSLVIPNSIKQIGEYACYDCNNLNTLSIPNSVISIGKYAFSACFALTSISIPNSISIIQKGTFGGCGLTHVEIPNSVEVIENNAFSGCTDLISIIIGNSVSNIGSEILYYCNNLKEIICTNTTPPTTDKKSFDGVRTATLYVPVGSKDAYASADGWSYFSNIKEIQMQTDPIVTIMDASNQGSVSFSYEEGKAFDFTVTPVTGYIVNTVLVNGEEISSDNGDYKIESVNEETIISVSYEIDPATGVNTLNANNLKVYGYNETLTVAGTEFGDTISIYDLNGAMLKTQNSVGSTNYISLDNGIYIVKVNGKSYKVIL